MSNNFMEQTLALAGVIQAATLVDELARNGAINSEDLETTVKSILNTNPNSVLDVYGDIPNLRIGLNGLRNLLSNESKGTTQEIVRYAMSLIHIEGKLRKNSKLLDNLFQGILKAQGQSEYFDSLTHDAVIGSLASAYSDSISKLNFRIQVTGNATLLQDERIASRIRAILLSGVRSAVLWQQKGGRRWHFLFYRNKIKKMAQEIQTRGLH